MKIIIEALDAISALEVLDDEIAILTDLSLYDEKPGSPCSPAKEGSGSSVDILIHFGKE